MYSLNPNFIDSKGSNKIYSANFNYFDMINSPNKAYWLGFIWADGYVAKRYRNQLKNNKQRVEYNLKIALKDIDSEHLNKFIKDLECNYPILFYKTKGFNQENPTIEARIFITNLHLGKILYDELGIVPNRHSINSIIKHIPKEFHKYFILGTFDGDGSFSYYRNESYGNKFSVSFGGSIELLQFIEHHLVSNNIVDEAKTENKTRKPHQRHKGEDGTWRIVTYSGRNQFFKILNYLYDSPIYLQRKYEKYIKILNNNL